MNSEPLISVFLDDERATPEGWTRTYSVHETIELLKTGRVEELSLDNDLGSGHHEGYEVMDWLEKECYQDPSFSVPKCYFHTANPGRRDYMRQVYLRILERRNLPVNRG